MSLVSTSSQTKYYMIRQMLFPIPQQSLRYDETVAKNHKLLYLGTSESDPVRISITRLAQRN